MRRWFYVSLATIVAPLWLAGVVRGQEHPGEHPGKPVEHPGKPAVKRNLPVEIQTAVNAYVKQKTPKGKTFSVYDPKTKTTWQLKLKKFHPVTKISDKFYFICTDFSAQNKNVLDLDFFLKPKGPGWEVTRMLIHKVNGKPRYTYVQTGGKWYRVEGKKKELLS